MTHPALGQVPEFRIAIVGATSSGKTNLMITAIWQFEKVFAEANGFKVKFADAAEERGYRMIVDRLEQGQVPDATLPIPIPHAFTLSITDEDEEQSCLLYLYDAAGEDFQDPQVLGGHPLHRYDALMFVIDPFNEEGTSQGALGLLDPAQLARANAKGTRANTIATALLNAMAQQLGTAPIGIHRIPVAVVVTKLDVCKLGDRYGIGKKDLKRRFASFTAAVNRSESDRDRVRALLLQIGLGNVVNLLEQNFYPASYFGASPLGRSWDAFDSSAFQPRGVLAPLVWLCDQTTALGDTDPFDVLFINSHVALIRALGGREGMAMRVGAWCGLAASVLMVLLLFLGMPWLLFTLTCGVPLVPLILLDLYLIYILVYKRYE